MLKGKHLVGEEQDSLLDSDKKEEFNKEIKALKNKIQSLRNEIAYLKAQRKVSGACDFLSQLGSSCNVFSYGLFPMWPLPISESESRESREDAEISEQIFNLERILSELKDRKKSVEKNYKAR